MDKLNETIRLCENVLANLKEMRETHAPVTLDAVKNAFPQGLVEDLAFSESETHITVKTKEYLGKENFSKAAAIVRGFGGEYVSAGRDSHFKIPK